MIYYKRVNGKLTESTENDYDSVLLTKEELASVRSEVNNLRKLYKDATSALTELAQSDTHGWAVKSEHETYREHPTRNKIEHLWQSVLTAPYSITEPMEAVQKLALEYINAHIGTTYIGEIGFDTDEELWNKSEVLEILIGFQQNSWEVSILHRSFLCPQSIF